MSNTWSQLFLVLLPVVVGAIIGVVPTALVEWARHRASLKTRWDSDIHRVCAEFAAAARRMLDFSEQDEPSDAESVKRDLRSEHSRLQTLMAEIRLLASQDVQAEARLVVRHTWAVYKLAASGVDPRATDYDSPPRERALASLFDFYVAVRRQLMVPNAEKMAPLNPSVDGGGFTQPRQAGHRASQA